MAVTKALLLAAAVMALAARGSLSQGRTALLRIKIEKDTTIGGVRCAPTGRARASVFSSGQLESCPLASDTIISDHRFEAGTWIHLTEDGTLRAVWLNHDTDLQGHRCKGTGYKGWSTEFHPSGTLRLCYPAREAIIDGIPCRGASFWAELVGITQVVFHESGQLRSCSVARDIERDGIRFGKRDRIELDVRGRATRIQEPPNNQR
jgi:hypothetical protein